MREQLERHPELLALGPGAALHAIVDRIVDAYVPVAESVREAIDEVEAEVFSSRGASPVERIYRLRREVLEFGRATGPLRPALRELTLPDVPNIDPRAGARTSATSPTTPPASATRSRASARSSPARCRRTLTQVSVRQNEDMRRISAWVAIIAVPTAVAGIYGMNFDHMPELGWRYGYPAVLLLIAGHLRRPLRPLPPLRLVVSEPVRERRA